MKKRKRSKLKLNRETLRNLEADKMTQVAGGVPGPCTSNRCSNNCTGANCTLGGSECVCPLTYTVWCPGG
ncbi:MAG: class I lanthipeptide [Acidobacteriota bacterium]